MADLTAAVAACHAPDLKFQTGASHRASTARKLIDDLFERLSLDEDFESKHPRGEHGHFGPGTAAGASTALEAAPPGARAWGGTAETIHTAISKQETGKLGEEIAGAYIRHAYGVDVNHLNYERNNFPIDLLGDQSLAVEVKTGLASNSDRAAQWRMTIGEPGDREKAWMAKLSPEELTRWNEHKQSAIAERKAAAIAAVEADTGAHLRATTVTMIVNPDTKLVDVYEFRGFHNRIGWKSPDAQAAYKGTYKYK
jgi:hypothetical protein